MNKTYTSHDSDTRIRVVSESKKIMEEVFALLRSRGFTTQTDREILKLYPILADTHWEGEKRDLLFKLEEYPSGFQIIFYEYSESDKKSGYYSPDKFSSLSYLSRCEFIVTRKRIRQLLEEKEFVNMANPEFKNAIDNVMYSIKSSSDYVAGKELSNYEHPDYNARDRDNKKLYNEQIKYYRDRKGRLMRGIVYHNINNMWWVVLNKHNYTNVAAFQLFDIATEEDLTPKIYSRKIPYRIKEAKLRKRFNEQFDYSMLHETHMSHLQSLVSHELLTHDSDMAMRVRKPLKKDTKILKTRGLIHSKIKVDGSYFKGREAITFNKDGFIGFAGWASGRNLKPFVRAFEKWLDWLDKEYEEEEKDG